MRESRRHWRRSPLGAVVRGLLASAAGIVAVDLLWFYRYKRGSGESGPVDREFSVGGRKAALRRLLSKGAGIALGQTDPESRVLGVPGAAETSREIR